MTDTRRQALLLALAAARATLAAARAEGEAAGAARERAVVVAYLRAQAEAGGDPWMVYVADEVEAGAHVAPAAG